MRRRSCVVGLACLLTVAVPVTGAAAAGRSPTEIQRPRADRVVGVHGQVRVVVRSRAALRDLRIAVNGRSVTRRFHGSAGAYRATLREGSGLRAGANELTVRTGDYEDFDRVDIVVARRAPRLLRLTDAAAGEPGAPVRAVVRVRKGATLRAWMNGHRVDHAFQPQGRRYVGRLGADDGVRPGRNHLEVLAYRERRGGRSAVRDVARATFRVHGVVAGAGRDRVVDAGQYVELHARAAGGGGDLGHHWAIVAAPDGARGAVLNDADTATPAFSATTAGTYLVRDSVAAAHGGASTDTVTIDVREDVPPMGWSLLMGFSERGAILVDGSVVPGTLKCSVDTDPRCASNYPFISYAIYNRQTLALEKSGILYYEVEDPSDLAALAARYKHDPTYLMVVNSSITKADDPAWGRLLDTLGVAKSTPAREKTNYGPVSIVGVIGSPPGSAFVSAPVCGRSCTLPTRASRMAGYVRLNPLSTEGGDFEFVRTDQIEFDTDAPAAPGLMKMTAGSQAVTGNRPTDDSSGFFLASLDSQTLAPLGQDVFVTNAPGGADRPAEAARLADALAAAVAGDNSRGRALVMLQAFGTPKGSSEAWVRAAGTIQALGGNAQVFAQLNQGGRDEPYQGRYALVGRVAMGGAPAAESSQSLTGRAIDGKLRGLLARSRDDQYLPLLADPTGSINFDLLRVVNRPTARDGGFPKFEGGEAAAVQMLGRDKDVMGVCAGAAPTCDVRRSYYARAGNWATIENALGGRAAEKACRDAVQSGAPFTGEECARAADQLHLEVSRRNRVAAYFGPEGLQGPFLGGDATALVNIAAIADEILRDVDPPTADSATSHVLAMIGHVVNLAGIAAGVLNPGIGSAASGIAAAFSLAGYLTNHDGSPDVIGPAVRSRAAQLGGDLSDRYKEITSYFTTEAQIVNSDWTKMTDVVTRLADDRRWELGDARTVKARIERATRQTIYESLIPVVYPVIYDLGTGFSDARDWICRSGDLVTVDKRLFQKTGAGAQMQWTMPPAKPGGAVETHVMAVGEIRAKGNRRDAHVPAPSPELTGKLFRDPDDRTTGEVGLYKLALFAPPAFRVFPRILQQRKPNSNPFGFWTCEDVPNPPGNSG